ncbi:MAG: hypothetical protein ACOX4K_07840 [Bacillota bacterium]
MEFLKEWARGVYLLAVLSSAAILMIPKSMQKQSKFVIELLMLLCIIAPVAGFIRKPIDAPSATWNYREQDYRDISLKAFYAGEVSRRVKDTAISVGLPVESVLVEVSGFAPGFTCSGINIYLSSPVEEGKTDSFARFLASYLAIDQSRIWFEQSQSGR